MLCTTQVLAERWSHELPCGSIQNCMTQNADRCVIYVTCNAFLRPVFVMLF